MKSEATSLAQLILLWRLMALSAKTAPSNTYIPHTKVLCLYSFQ